MPNVLSVLLMLGILSVLIIIHEFGHFSVARYFGFQTPVFGFGLPFGPSWTLGEKWGTQFKIHALLLGGYVAIPELGDESSMAHDAYGVPLKPFKKFPIWQRALVAFAGVGMNMIFAYIVMVAMVCMVGVPVDKVYVKELPNSLPMARDAGVLVGDRIDAIDSMKVKTTGQVIEYLTKHKAQAVTLHILREPEDLRGKPEGEAKAEHVDIRATTNADGRLGMGLVPAIEKLNAPPTEIASRAFTELCDLTGQMVSTLGRMMHQIFFGWMEHKAPGAPAGASLGDLHGVLVVIKWGAELAQNDWTQLFQFTALISMDLAIVNLLPIPALDGGHLFFQLLEAIRGKPMEEKVQGELVKWGFISLITLMAIIMVNDIRALFTGELDYNKLKSKKQGQKLAPPAGTEQNKGQAGTGESKTQPAPTGTEENKNQPTPPAAEQKSQEPDSVTPKPAPAPASSTP